MDKKAIEELFEKVSKHFDVVPEDAKKFFTMFIKETLKYRDQLVAEGEEPLKVEEVQTALSLLEEVLVTKTLPKDLSKRISVLLKRWLVRINEDYT